MSALAERAVAAPGRASRTACAVAALLFAALAAVTLASDGVLVGDKFHDLWILVDALSRGAAGQIPHVDFHTPVGQVFLAPYYLVAQFGGLSGSSTLHANLVAGAFILALATAAFAGRLWSPLFVAAVMLSVTTAITPRSIGDEITRYDHLAPYNRWAWSLIVIAGVVAFVRRDGAETRLGRLGDGLVMGVTLAALYYLKITFFVGAVGLVAVATVLRDFPLRAAAVAALVLGVAVAAVEATLGNNGAYLQDMLMAFRANVDASNVERMSKVDNHLFEGAVYGLAMCAVLWLLQPAPTLWGWLRLWWRELLAGSVLLLACAGTAVQNYPRWEGPLFVAAIIAVAERARRRARAAGDPSAGRRRQGAAWLLVAGIALQYPVMDSVAVVGHAIESRGTSACTLRGLAGTPLADVKLPATAYAPSDAGAELLDGCAFARTKDTYWSVEFPHEPRRTHEAMALLRGAATASDRLHVAEFANPYSFLTGTVPARNALLWWDYGRSYSKAAHPAPEPMLADATMVLVGTPLHRFKHGEEWLSVYGDTLRRDFRLAAESSYWQVWLRNDRIPSAPAR